MKYAITYFQKFILDWVARRITIQSHKHKSNIVEYYSILTKAARESFYEDNKATLDDFLKECHKESLKIEYFPKARH